MNHIITCLVLFVCPSLIYSVIVTSPSGKIEGKIIQHNGTDVLQFLGVPYARPPIGDLMLEKTQPVEPWQNTLNATAFGAACHQRIASYDTEGPHNRKMSHDCLLLNIFVPKNITTSHSRAVMIFIHGGSFMHGTANAWDGSLLAITGDVIVVSINYRLDVYGFMSTGDGVIPGNYGLWDQRQAILWVKANIASFGGDGSKITIFGESAGSYSIGMHMISPHNVGLFQRVISESGIAVSPIALTFDAISYARSVSDSLNCTNVTGGWNTGYFKNCLKTRNITDVLEASLQAGDAGMLAYRRVIAPVVDSDFIVANPVISLARNDVPFRNVDLMVGTNSAEGGLIIGPLKQYQQQYNFSIDNGIPRNIFRDHIATAVVRDYFKNEKNVLDKLMEVYSEDGISDETQARKAVDMYGDFILQAPSIEILQYHSKMATSRKTYEYYFTHVPENQNLPAWFQGANHADELSFVFGPTLTSVNISTTEIKVSEVIQRYWTNFAKYGNPNGESGTKWPSFNTTTRHYMDLNIQPTTGQHLLKDRVNLWLDEIPSLLKPTSSSSTIHYNTMATTLVLLVMSLLNGR
ncbi:acetylcholinesterase [Patella vulgata]|uniref:acetylcholinesterase n=1 Tax=Patella vulgata TaxID=6465 RepID=UPI0024A88835|nr:acetylcholinesterase [Patella vulgata]